MVAYDFGIKHNILRRLASQGCKLTVVPAAYPAEKVLALKPDGIFLSNGPVRLPPQTAELYYGQKRAVGRVRCSSCILFCNVLEQLLFDAVCKS